MERRDVVLISGGGRGIGRAIAHAFAAAGYSVAVGARTQREIEGVAGECREQGGCALAVRLDVTSSASCQTAVTRCEQELGPVEVLVHAAGILTSGRFTDLDGAAWERTLAVNLTGPFHLTSAALPGMLRRAHGAVIAISSVAGKVGAKYYTAYGASKHGLIGLMRGLAAEYPRSGVTFNCVCPAYTDTGMAEEVITRIMERTGRDRETVLKSVVTPQGRLVRPEEVAALCLFLAGPEGRGISGQAINVDGGQVQS